MKFSMSRQALTTTVSAICLGALANTAGAQDLDLGEIVVTPNRTPTELSKTGSSVTVIDQEQIEEQSQPLVTDYLSRVPGVYVASQGGAGKETSLSLRGADKKYIKTLLNGLDISDVSATQTQTSYEYLLVGGIRNIEVLKGSQSTLYGSDAVAGVISLSTLNNEAIGTSHRVGLEAGSHESIRASYGLSHISDTSRFALDLAGLYSGGISSALANGDPLIDPGTGLEDDPFKEISGTFAFEKDLDGFTIFGSGAMLNARSDYDDSGLPPTDNEVNHNDFRLFGGRTGISFDLFDGRMQNTVSAQLLQIDREIDSASVFSGFVSPFLGEYEGKRAKLDYQGSVEVNDQLAVQFGADYERRQSHIMNNFGTDTKDADWLLGGWTQLVAQPVENLTVTAGVRFDEHDRFGSYTTYRGTAAYLLPAYSTTLRGSVGTGFRAPSLYESNYVSYLPHIPMPNLRPEESFSWDVGIDQHFDGERAVASLTYFQLDTENLIDYDFADDTYIQLQGTTRRQGVEAAVNYALTETFALGANYTYTTAVQADDARRPRIPRHIVGLTASYEPSEQWSLSSDAKIVLDILDVTSAGQVELDDYFLLNAKVAYKPTEDTELYLRGENLLDQDYQTVSGYGTPGISVFAGFKAKFGQ
ncbi:TonB-dependent receptor plug domain-containing protein [Nitratireductor basaltis]|uniref:TonB-dependent receptor n=1 Tax=Nitratireductor basaltis TaxID=472175 RepID=A0A084U9L0_9HYPH|nr:TonB-dependent receptor [Nitratireductor basaltis]KFB09646.1 TonB-dependent receptor precursor [Nitratireductor basaltis]